MDVFDLRNRVISEYSPTMELGVDIAQLNAVNLRNVPPMTEGLAVAR